MKLKFPNLLKPLGNIIQQNDWSSYPSELIYFALFTMRHPVGIKYDFLPCRLIGQPSDWASSQLFIQGKNDTIYGKLYKNKMNGLNSFYSTLEAGMDHILNSNQKIAYFQNIDYVNSIKETHCKV